MTLSKWATPQTPWRLALLEHDLYFKLRTFSFTSPWFHWCCCWTAELLMFFFRMPWRQNPGGTAGRCAATAAHGLPDRDNCVSLLLRQCGPGRDPRMPGKKEGVRQRLKRLTTKQTRTLLASIILTNVCFLRNKLDEVQANMWVGLQRG